MLENKFQAKLIKKIKKMFCGCIVMKNDSGYIQGIPDLLILYRNKWAALECKKSANEMASWIAAYKSDLELTRSGFVDFRRASESDFTLWFETIKGNLSEDAAGNLQNQVDAATKAAFERYYSLVDKTTKINKNSDGKTSSIVETSSEAVSTTTFKATDNSKIITTQIVPNSGNYNYTKTTKIETVEGGKLITESYEKTVKPAE